MGAASTASSGFGSRIVGIGEWQHMPKFPRLKKKYLSHLKMQKERATTLFSIRNAAEKMQKELAFTTHCEKEHLSFQSFKIPLGMLKKRSKKPISRMKRSYTVDFAAAQAEDSPVPQQIPQDSSKERLTPTDEEEDLESQNFHEEDVGVPVRRSSNHLVTAIIESSPREQREAGASEAGSCSSEIVPRINSSNIIKRDNINEQVGRYLEEFLRDAPKIQTFFAG